MSTYLIEFRFFGTVKHEIQQLIWEVNRIFRIVPNHRPVPHISLAGPIMTRDASRLVKDFKNLCDSSQIMHFEIEGYGTFEDANVVFIDIKPDVRMDKFRWELSKTIQPYCKLQTYDYSREFNYHATISMKLPEHKFQQVKEYINNKPKLHYKHVLMRAAIIKDGRILVEYDFLLRRLLQRWEAKSSTVLSETFERLKGYLGDKNLEKEELSFKIQEITIPYRAGFFQRLFGMNKRIFFISDTHFDHTNIIRYCNRPFKNTSEMNEVMLKNWNDTVKINDFVFFLGDMSFGKGSRSADYWMSKLNGNIFFIRGFRYDSTSGKRVQHDRISRKENVFDSLILNYKGQRILLIHDPENIPKDWKGWVIAGHHHNNKTGEYPLVNNKTKRMNVSVELINYTPIELDKLIDMMD